MTATACYLVGSLILLVGTVATDAPPFMTVASGLFLLGSIVALLKEHRT